MIIDTHAHLYWEYFKENFDDYIQRAVDAGVTGIVNVGVDIPTSEEALRQAQGILKEKGILAYSSIGIHPEEALKYYSNKSQVTSNKIEEDIQKLEEIYNQNPEKVVMIGECGLDYFFREEEIASSQTPRNDVKELQKKLFQAQIELAKKLNLPLTVHCRDDRSKNPQNTECWDQVIEMTKDHFGIYHCYSGLAQTTKRVLEKTKFLISFAGNLTYKNNEYLREAVKVIPLERIVVETDCPFLPPQKFRGQQNEPSFITETVACIAQIKGLSVNEVTKITSQNAQRLTK